MLRTTPAHSRASPGRERLRPLINSSGSDVRHCAARPGPACSGGDIFDAPEFIELVTHVSSAELDIKKRLEQRLDRNIARHTVAGDEPSGRHEQLHQAVSFRRRGGARVKDRFLTDQPGDRVWIKIPGARFAHNDVPVGERIEYVPFFSREFFGLHLRVIRITLAEHIERLKIIATPAIDACLGEVKTRTGGRRFESAVELTERHSSRPITFS